MFHYAPFLKFILHINYTLTVIRCQVNYSDIPVKTSWRQLDPDHDSAQAPYFVRFA